MSGFGGGFGSSPPGGFGGGGGFGQPPAAPGSMFGSPAPAAPTGGFPSSPFGGSNNAQPAPVSFSSGSNMNSGFGQPSSFGAPNNNNSGGFGAPSTSNQGFGGQQAGGFGNNNNSSGFGSSPFGSSPQNQAQPMDVPNPFGSSQAGSPAVSFGMSSNVMQAPAPSFGAPAPSSGGGMSFGAPASFGGSAPAPSSSPFGNGGGGGGMSFATPASSNSGPGGFHRHTASVEMGGSDSPVMSAFGGSFHATNPSTHSTGSLSPIPEDAMGDAFGSNNNNNDDHHNNNTMMGGGPFSSQPSGGGGGGGDDGGRADAEKEKLAKLKAKLEAKKKKLAEKQKKKEEADNSNSNQQGGGDGNRKQSRDRDRDRDNNKRQQGRHPDRSRSSSPPPPADSDQQARAARNAERFAQSTNTATQAHMPSELRGVTNVPRPTVTSAVGGEANRENLAQATNLVGTCQFMCPDEELLRRERESDIQLLEIPDPGGIHPIGWTLRNTAVKRFRRSAADYKLDVPEWVRPPDVLEEVCSYLEEWVMERDRQGPDRRFPQNATPDSMSLYTFCWDRTRMIRKDFILQNYVGTGGACDARAVRCHERIARWHAMCEHQLSHINEFVTMQSQQNIQELGQAMKTLNQYYDDSLGRAVVEVPDEEGRETRRDFAKFSHGCKSDACQGGNPIDYDGSPLNNTSDVSSLPSPRLIGKSMVNSPTRGTAEPEMRGLYILLTMNNDGGMEVMRYSAALYRERPEIYNSRPVQLALDIFKAKKDRNYVRFFRILRDPATPYLFSCLMFKHVENFRKIAFRIMYKAYGTRREGKPIYDAYPLKRLQHLLCFEDMDEARAACKHYNIVVNEVNVRSSSSGKTGKTEVIFWKASDFREPTDPVKGTILPLRPKKMLRWIESKLNGATRLGVCRGEVSGVGASLSQLPPAKVPLVAPQVPAQSQSASPSTPTDLPGAPQTSTDPDVAQAGELLRKQQELLMKQKVEAEAKEKEKQREEAERLKAEQRRLAKEEKRLKEQQRKEDELKRRREEIKRREEERQKKLREERIKKEDERRRLEELKAQEEERKKKEEEERRRKLKEEARLKAEAEKREKERQERLRREAEERRQREIEAEKERQRQAELERIRKEEERKRLELLRVQEEERKRREAIARQKARELDERVDKARKLLLVRRFRQRLPRQFVSRARTEESMKRIDPTFCLVSSPISGDSMQREIRVARRASHTRTVSEIVDCRKILNRILSKETLPLDVASMILSALCKDDDLMEKVRCTKYRGKESGLVRATFLFKVAVILPDPSGLEERSMYELIHTWLNRRLEYGKTDTIQQDDLSGTLSAEVRVRFVKADSWGGPCTCDAALVVIPPSFCNGDWSNSHKVDTISAAFNCVDPGTPRVAYVMGESFDSDYYSTVNQYLARCIPTDAEEFPVVFPSAISEAALEGSLMSSLRSLVSAFAVEETPLIIEQVSVLKMASKCISDTLWRSPGTDSLRSAVTALKQLETDLLHVGQEVADTWSSWPSSCFSGEGGLVRDYFGDGLHLPTVWSSTVFLAAGRSKIMDLHQTLQSTSIPQVVGQLLSRASANMQEECEEMLERRQYRKCLQKALDFVAMDVETTIYLPKGMAEKIVNDSITKVLKDAGFPLTNMNGENAIQFSNLSESFGGDDDDDDDDNNEAALTTYTRPRTYSREVNFVDGEAIDDEGVFQKARDIFEVSRTISPIPLSTMTTPSPLGTRSPPRTLSPPPGISSGTKRSWIGMSVGGGGDHDRDGDEITEDDLIGRDGGGTTGTTAATPMRSPGVYHHHQYSGSATTGSAKKRMRDASYDGGNNVVRSSRDCEESSAFTRKLQTLLSGEATVDMDVGTTGTTLAKILQNCRDPPPLLDGGSTTTPI